MPYGQSSRLPLGEESEATEPYLAHFAYFFGKTGIEIRQSGHRNSAKWARQLSTSAKTDFLKAKIECGAGGRKYVEGTGSKIRVSPRVDIPNF